MFSCLCFFARAQAATFRQEQASRLRAKLTHLSLAKQSKLKILESTQLKLKSISDPDMIRMLLIQSLGLVKEGQIKVVFEDSENP